jgi:hypothetical protein
MSTSSPSRSGARPVRALDRPLGRRLARAAEDADPVAVAYADGEVAARRVAVVAVDSVDAEGLRTAARAVGAQRGWDTVA